MKHRKTFRIDKLFGLATLVCLLVITLMVYNDFFKDTVSEGNVIGKETESETRTSGYLNDNKNVESKGASSKAVVCLDPSKGGKDTGVSSSGRKEKDINLEMALDIKSKLESDGIEVVMTRTSDRDVTDEERVKICNSSKVYICVSLRMNSYNADTSVSGAESYIHTTKPVEAAELSRIILKSMEKSTGIKNRGVKTGTVADAKDNYYINAHSKCTSTVIDMGFITNVSDLKKVTTDKTKKSHSRWHKRLFKTSGVILMAGINQKNIRNFCIIAHIDHGKSTLADRIIEKTGLLTSREMQEQILDNMDLERERGITIKAQTVRTVYKASDGQEYIFNLIDTPGHVDFNYEVSRALAACDGAILVVDAAQGIEAQTLANVYLALDHDLDVFPVINKIDLPSAEPERVIEEIEDVIGIEAQDAPLISAKNGINIEEVLEQIVTKIPAPSGDASAPLSALIFDSLYDAYKGVIIFVRIKEGTVKKGTKIRMMATGAVEEVVEVGYFGAGRFIPCDELTAGMVGYITASIKNVRDTRVGDTVTDNDRPCEQPLPGYKKVNPMVYCGLYPADGAKYQDLRDALEKLQLNDAALQFEPETSIALGFGFRCGFLGLLHLEIIQERLEREYNLDLVTTAPGVIYKVHKTNGDVIDLTNPSNMPDPSEIDYMEEPMVSAEIMVTTEFVGPIMKLCQERRGIYNGMEYIEQTRALLKYDIPLNEIIYDFFDALKSRSRGYASFDYEMKGYERSKLVKLDILINKEEVDALSFIVFAGNAEERGRKMCEKLKEEIPRQQFEIPIQAAIGSKVIARETVKALRKDVLAKCYGGDISRKKKLLEKQKEGKKRMRQIGNVEIPQKAFMSVLKLDDE